ncbi:MAG: hypothetical protein IKK74_04490 [Clostridia bacterium]|nr:hypothetical protein [Clostridia bacterium]
MQKPLYQSIRASFSKDIYMPVCPVVAAPTVVLEVKKADDLSALTCPTPPQNVILRVSPDLTVEGNPLYDVLALCSRTVPILYIDDEATVAPLAEFCDLNHVGDAILCTAFEKKELLSKAYDLMPILRGMLDCRGISPEIEKLPSVCVSNGATSVILDPEVATADAVHSLQQRFIHTVTYGHFGKAAARGVNGIITADLAGAYSFLTSFPEGTNFRRRALIAHKGFQNNGKYSENTITSVVAAAEHHFEGAEIDVKLTVDNVPVVMHNTNTKGLFDCEVAVTEESTYEFLSSLRRIEHPNETIDTFVDLMHKMKEHPDTPVLIEIKPSAKYHKVELLTAMTDEILHDGLSQENCICIMGGTLEPGLRYVHKRIPDLPLGWCESGSGVPTTKEESEDLLYRVARLSEGCAASYNCEDVHCSRIFNEYAKFRMLHVFVWSRSWTLSPSKWEENGPSNDKTYLSGFDAWTTDHGEYFLGYPIALEPTENAPECILHFRDGHTETALCEELQVGDEKYYLYKIDLHFGDSYYICSEPKGE